MSIFKDLKQLIYDIDKQKEIICDLQDEYYDLDDPDVYLSKVGCERRQYRIRMRKKQDEINMAKNERNLMKEKLKEIILNEPDD